MLNVNALSRVLLITHKEVEIVWASPLQTDTPVEYYEVRWFVKTEPDANKTSVSTKEARAHIMDLAENTEYGFQVRCKTSGGWGAYSNVLYAHTSHSITPGKILGDITLFI